MDNFTKQKISDIKKNGYSLDIGEALSETLKNYQKTVWISGAAFLLFALVLTGITLGLSAIVFGAGTFAELVGDFRVANFSLVSAFIELLMGVVLAAVICPFYAGLLKTCHLASQSKPFDFSTVFDYYKSEYLRQLIISGVLISVVTSGFVTIIGFGGYYFMAAIFRYIVQFITLFTIPCIIFGNLKAVQAIESSIILVFKNFAIILILMVVSVIMAASGIIALCIGIFFTLPIIFSMQYIIYKKAVGIYDDDELDKIGTVY
ncbi:MAG TPA: hypothetical protein VFR70_05430 [Flavobacterium sp.]|nr:hypothetical protein [Flavobacterium sp.]